MDDRSPLKRAWFFVFGGVRDLERGFGAVDDSWRKIDFAQDGRSSER